MMQARMVQGHGNASSRRTVLPHARRLLDRALLGNIAALSGVQFARYILPLVTIPYLTRVLGLEGWGNLAYIEAFALLLGTLVEFSFNFTATREVARHQDHPHARSRILAGVIGAKAVLASGAVALACIAPWFSPRLSADPRLFSAGVFFAIVQSLSPLWYFQGLERMRLVAVLDVAGKLLGAAGILAFVRAPSDAWKALAAQGVGVLLPSAVALVAAYRDVPFRAPTPGLAWAALRSSWLLFVSQIFINLYISGITLALGLVAPPGVVGYFAGAQKIARAVVRMTVPISLALFPRISSLASRRHEEARAQAHAGALLMAFAGLSLGACLFVAAPILVRLILGEGFGPSVTALRLLALLAPLAALSNAFGIQWMLPLGLDREFNAIVIAAGTGAVLLTLLVAPAYGHLGAALVAVASEGFVTGATFAVLRKRGLDLLDRRFSPHPVTPAQPDSTV